MYFYIRKREIIRSIRNFCFSISIINESDNSLQYGYRKVLKPLSPYDVNNETKTFHFYLYISVLLIQLIDSPLTLALRYHFSTKSV